MSERPMPDVVELTPKPEDDRRARSMETGRKLATAILRPYEAQQVEILALKARLDRLERAILPREAEGGALPDACRHRSSACRRLNLKRVSPCSAL
jgi:hypothetical protein